MCRTVTLMPLQDIVHLYVQQDFWPLPPPPPPRSCWGWTQVEVAHLSRSNSTSSTRKSLVSTSLWICCRSSSSFCRSSLDLSLSAAHDSRRTSWSAFLLRELKAVWEDSSIHHHPGDGGGRPGVRLAKRPDRVKAKTPFIQRLFR